MPKKPKNKETHLCPVCNKPIPAGRIEALIMLDKPKHLWTCVLHSTEKKKNGIYMGEAGTSELRIVDKVYQDSVRDIFRKSSAEVETEEDGD